MKIRRGTEIEDPAPAEEQNTPAHECDHAAHVRIEEKLNRLLALLEDDDE